MCWESNNIPEVKTAEEDIKTFKVICRNSDSELYSYFFYESYSIGEIKRKIILHHELSSNSYTYFIHKGYHSYDKSIKYKYYDGIIKVGDLLEIYSPNGPLSSMFVFSTLCIVECTIPKGTKYCLNEGGEYVSEQIIVDKILEEY